MGGQYLSNRLLLYLPLTENRDAEVLSQCHFFLCDPCVLCERYIESFALVAINWYDLGKKNNAEPA